MGHQLAGAQLHCSVGETDREHLGSWLERLRLETFYSRRETRSHSEAPDSPGPTGSLTVDSLIHSPNCSLNSRVPEHGSLGAAALMTGCKASSSLP